MTNHSLILGGAKSGKTGFAEGVALKGNQKPLYVATGRAYDEEMKLRISAHQQARGDHFDTVEQPINLISALERARSKYDRVLVDCLTLWITNLMMADYDVDESVEALAHWLSTNDDISVVLVSNEVGQGVIPDNKMAREFVDHAGIAHQELSRICQNVVFVTAGIPQNLKGDLA
ncbi:bifunctional adenosylcobinamide kinase/adenosylcobinamide-phosphate guanylyltransferase [Maritalea sp. S77]|uniref:bifunctional adenosylcobinamide kinase/adenosylcobinamide-phosphate guanylyltransferase n=1 Tax=Maritalea sp. S77 TaxID=3415125 RepID=UPI003C7A9F5A